MWQVKQICFTVICSEQKPMTDRWNTGRFFTCPSLVQYQNEKMLMSHPLFSTRWWILWKSSSGWLPGIFSFRYWTEGQLRKSPCRSVSLSAAVFRLHSASEDQKTLDCTITWASHTVQKKIHSSNLAQIQCWQPKSSKLYANLTSNQVIKQFYTPYQRSKPYTNCDDISHASCTKENTNLSALRHQEETSGCINIGRTLQKSQNMQTGSPSDFEWVGGWWTRLGVGLGEPDYTICWLTRHENVQCNTDYWFWI